MKKHSTPTQTDGWAFCIWETVNVVNSVCSAYIFLNIYYGIVSIGDLSYLTILE